MNILKWTLIAALVFLLQTQWPFINNFTNLTVILVYYFGLKSYQRNTARGFSGARAELGSVAFGMTIGLMEDILSGTMIGPGVLSKGLLGLITPVIFTDMVFKWTRVWGAVVVITLTLFDGSVLISSRVLFTGIHVTAGTLFQILCVQSFFNLPFGLMLRP